MLLAFVIVLHSWVRWGIVAAILYVIWIALSRRKKKWTEREARVARAWVGLSDVQLVIGMVLYFGISPIAEIARSDSATAVDGAIRFFGYVHPIAMTLYVIGAHVTWVLVRRTDVAASRYRRLLVGTLLSAVVLLCAIPWPFLEHGRPLVRP